MTSPSSESHRKISHTGVVKKLQSQKFSRQFLFIMLFGITFVFINTIKIFLLPIVIATVFTTLFYPMYLKILHLFKNRRGIAAFFCCLLLFIGLLIPIYALFNLVAGEAVNFYQSAEQTVKRIIEQGEDGPLGTIKNSAWFKRFSLDRLNWQAAIQDAAKTFGAVLAAAITKTSTSVLAILLNVLVTLFIIFYFFKDGERILTKIREFLPLRDEYQDALISRFASVSRATIKGSLLIGLIQSTLGALTLWIFGVPSPILWFVVMLILSLIPLVGAWLVMHPAAIIQILTGNVWQGIGIFLITIFVISTVDNFLRPRLVGQFSGLHDLLIFFSVLGGIQAFGPLGVIVGPIIAAFFVTILEIYSKEFRSKLKLSQSEPAAH